MLAVLITIPIGSMLMHSLAPKALDHEEAIPIVASNEKSKKDIEKKLKFEDRK